MLPLGCFFHVLHQAPTHIHMNAIREVSPWNPVQRKEAGTVASRRGLMALHEEWANKHFPVKLKEAIHCFLEHANLDRIHPVECFENSRSCFYLCSWNTLLENIKWTPYPNLGKVWATFGSKCHFPWLTPCTLNGDKSKGVPNCILCPFLAILQSKTTYASSAQTQLRLNQWNNSCWLQESGVRVGHSGKSIVSLTGRGFCFIPETETFLVWHLVLATNTVQTYQTQQIKDTTKSTALKTQVTKII